jgi:hypothetical protein
MDNPWTTSLLTIAPSGRIISRESIDKIDKKSRTEKNESSYIPVPSSREIGIFCHDLVTRTEDRVADEHKDFSHLPIEHAIKKWEGQED